MRRPRNYTGIGRKQTRAVRECCISKRKHAREVISCDFPQVFPQVWKTLGIDQTRMGFTRPERPEKDADCSTVRLALTLLETVRYHGRPRSIGNGFHQGEKNIS